MSFWSGRRVFLTGHTGFKGSWLALWLEALGAQVTGFALAPSTTPSLFALARLDERMQSVIGDIRDLAALQAALTAARPDVVFHLAAQSLVRRSYADPVATYAVNVMGTVHVLEAARRAAAAAGAPCTVVNVTSDKCYENREWAWGYREHEPMGGFDPYSSSKGCAELVTAAYRRSFCGPLGAPVRLASARAGNVIGGGDWSEDRLIPDCVRAAAEGRAIPVRNPDSVRPWQHVLEPLAGYLRLAERLAGDDAFAQGWNFGPHDSDTRPVRWIVDSFTRGWGGTARWEPVSGGGVHEAGVLKLDSSLARQKLGWAPRLTLAEGMAWTVEWYRRQHAGEDAAALTLHQIRTYQERRTDTP